MNRILKFATPFAGAVMALGLSVTAATAAAPPIFESNFGSVILSGDDNTTGAALPFNFSFYGTSYNSVDVSTNGFLSFGGANGNGCCSGDLGGFLAGDPRIAAEWFDLVDDVYLNTDVAGRAVITWQGGEFSAGGSFTTQAQLFDTGVIVLGFSGPSIPVTHASLTGITTGGGTADPGASDLSAANFSTNAGAIYETYAANTFDLNGRNVIFSPNGQGGYSVSNTALDAVPEPTTWALMLTGFLGAGAMLRRRRQVACAA